MMRSKKARVGAMGSLAAALSLVACGGNRSVVGGPLDAGHDLGVIDTGPVDTGLFDAGADTGPVDTGPADTGPEAGGDAATGDVSLADAPEAGGPCTRSAECASSPDGRVCDTASGRCVPCTATEDLCPAGQYCDGTMNRCTAGCRDDSACTSGPDPDAGLGGDASLGDGGLVTAQRRCDPGTRSCVVCVTDAHCGLGRLCVGNVCVAGCSTSQGCPTGQTCCSGACVDTQSSIAHCAACDVRCTVPNGAAACTNGTCAVAQCTAPFADCNAQRDDGCETDTSRDLAHCGACNSACTMRPNMSAQCLAGRCERSCLTGFADCDGDPTNGCETDLRSSAVHCGACNLRCNAPNGVASCNAGVCGIARCNDNFGDCDGDASNGCETDTRASVAHCGGCGAACQNRPNAPAVCAGGSCALVCAGGFQDCDSNPNNGCEVDLRSDAAHCGACGRSCAVQGGQGRCTAGSCSIAMCTGQMADCDQNVSNGCEVDTQSNLSHCGGCGVVCPSRSNATSTCMGGRCGYTCLANRADCDSDANNGCETDTQSSAAHCGGCGRACASRPNTVASCASASCQYRCAAGFGDCDGNAANGCETNLATSPNHCGACNTVCNLANAVSACTAGACIVSGCNTGYGDCDNNPGNGCEVDFQSNNAHCGRCGAVCSSGNSCYAGRCSATCGDPSPLPAPATGCINIAPLAVAEGSGSYAGQVASRANDGNRCTAWNAGNYPQQTLLLDFGSAQTLSGITLMPEMSPGTATVTHLVETSNDRSTWAVARTITQVMTNAQTYPFTFTAVSARYLRVRSTASPSWIAWREIAVFRCP
ncbi:MAG: discoidin domain-containing protein [Myxococcales bacterium]|nr:discoidin domain-containing protein [Myxococcales bacterium]